jgi:hypothetical protein
MNQAKSIFMEYLSTMPDAANAARTVWCRHHHKRRWARGKRQRERTEGARYQRRGIAEVASKPN